MGSRVFYMSFVKGIVSGITSVGGGIFRGTKTGANFGKYVGGELAGSRMRYLIDDEAFKISGMSASQVDDTIRIVSDNPKILDDLTEGTIEREQAIAQLSKKFSDAGIRSTNTANRNLAERVVRSAADYSNRSKIYLRLGQLGGGGFVLATAGVLIYGIASTISAILGGAFDKLLDASAESDTGTFIMMGVVIGGSILAINFVRETIS